MIPIINVSMLAVAKALILFALFLYIIFAFVVVRQVKMMTDTIEVGIEFAIRLLSYIHLAFSIFVFFLALITL